MNLQTDTKLFLIFFIFFAGVALLVDWCGWRGCRRLGTKIDEGLLLDEEPVLDLVVGGDSSLDENSIVVKVSPPSVTFSNVPCFVLSGHIPICKFTDEQWQIITNICKAPVTNEVVMFMGPEDDDET